MIACFCLCLPPQLPDASRDGSMGSMDGLRPLPTADDDMRETARARLAAHLLRRLPGPGDHHSLVPGLSLYRRDGFCPPVSTLYEPSLSLVVQGRKRVVLGAETHEYGAGEFALTSVDLPTIAQVLDGAETYPFLSILLKLDPTAVKAMAAEIDLEGIPVTVAGSAMAVGTASANLLDAISRLAALEDCPGDIPILGRMALREIVYRLLTGPASARLRLMVTSGTRCERIGQAIEWLRHHFAEPVRVETLAETAAMGVSTFHHHFVAITRMSPLQYQKRLRLHEARRLMLAEGLDAAAAAFRVGYESATQFSREYRRLFGAPPIRDVAALRGPTPAPVMAAE